MSKEFERTLIKAKTSHGVKHEDSIRKYGCFGLANS
jgi:hypothetical protein